MITAAAFHAHDYGVRGEPADGDKVGTSRFNYARIAGGQSGVMSGQCPVRRDEGFNVNGEICSKITVPGEGFEPPTFGLQNRCTTTVLTRHFNDLGVISVERFC